MGAEGPRAGALRAWPRLRGVLKGSEDGLGVAHREGHPQHRWGLRSATGINSFTEKAPSPVQKRPRLAVPELTRPDGLRLCLGERVAYVLAPVG